MQLVVFFWHIFAQSGSYFQFFSRDENVSTKSSSRVLLLRFVSPRDPMKSTEESFSSEKCLRGANVFSVSVRHISLPGPGARKCSDILQHSSQLSVLSLSLCSVAAMYRAWTGCWAGHRRYRALSLVTLPSQYHTTNNTPLHHKILDGKRENSPSPKYRTDTGQELTTG